MLPHHIRICHRHALSFLSLEIEELKRTLAHHHLLRNDRDLLERRLRELEADYETLIQYDFI